MKIAIEDIPDEGLNLDIGEKLKLDDDFVISPVTANLALHKTGREVIVNGRLKAVLDFQCSRCLKNFRKDLDIPINVVYDATEEMPAERHELKGDEMDMGFYAGDQIDLDELLREQVLLNVQMKPLCDENCRGICPQCGKDLNIDTCNCEKKVTDPRLEVLKTLLEKRKE